MITSVRPKLLLGVAAAALLAWGVTQMAPGAAAETQAMPAPAVDTKSAGPATQTATFAGGCFWGVQGVFEHVKGVTKAVSGYAGGSVADPGYERVSTGTTGHAESVSVTFDPSQVSYGTLLRIFFSVALDPTQVNRQGPDYGTQYRSVLFVANAEQERVARAYVAQLDAAHVFYPAEAYHQDYLEHHPDAPYIAINDIPKVHALQTLFPDLWQTKPILVAGN
jgi:peptide-methionine (S)-S-oxide reductase